ncbi:MAG: DUF4377 domain-containing protein [Caldilineales bacterium]
MLVPNREPCVGVAPQVCYQVKETPDGEYTLFYDEIQGFEYEPGYEYQLTVERTTVPNPRPMHRPLSTAWSRWSARHL